VKSDFDHCDPHEIQLDVAQDKCHQNFDETGSFAGVNSSVIAQLREAAGFFFNIAKLPFGNSEISTLSAGTVIAQSYHRQEPPLKGGNNHGRQNKRNEGGNSMATVHGSRPLGERHDGRLLWSKDETLVAGAMV